MGFINKLIKKGIFGLMLCFSFFLFFGGEKIDAASNCTIEINDGNKYLVLNTISNWSDNGVTIMCDGVKNNDVSVSINGDVIDLSSADVEDYLVNAGFYKIKYYLTTDQSVAITRHVRVLPANLNSVRNIWVGEFEENTSADDTFVKIVEHGSNYLAIGNFGTIGYVTYFNSLGEYRWHEEFANITLMDIASSKDASGNIFFIVGKNATNKGFIKPIQLNVSTGINSGYGDYIEFSSAGVETNNMTIANKVVVSANCVYVAGYLTKTDGTKIGKIAKLTKNEAILSNLAYFTNTIESEYNSIITIQDTALKVVAVGTTSVESYIGAAGGLVTICNEDLSTCTNENPYIWENSNGATTTTTVFNDIKQQSDGSYVVVGKSKVDKVTGNSITNNSGLEDSIVVLMDNSFVIKDVVLTGSSSSDELVSIKNISSNQFVAVGNKAGQAIYLNIVVREGVLSIEENAISGRNGNVEIKDVFVRKNANEEINFIFVGATQATIVENIIVMNNSGGKDAFFIMLDDTDFSNFETINIQQGTAICSDGSTSCSASQMLESYWLNYGTKKVAISSASQISSNSTTTYDVYHSFDNNQGVSFILGRKIVVSANPVAPDLSTDKMGIDKWYLYSRPQNIGSNVSGRERKELWTTRYYPVDNNLSKKSGTDYYIISGGKFVKDTSDRTYTYSNYIKLEEEPLNTTVAFQSVEKAREFALLQEFARIAVVNEKYVYATSGINAFQGETASLSTQAYYFVYYIDLSITDASGCATSNGVLYGTCTEYTGYAFASLNRIKDIAELIVDKYDYFVSESNYRFNPNGNVSLPSTTYFKEEMSTERYVQSTVVNLTNNLYLEVSHYPFEEDENGKYVISNTADVSFVLGTAEKTRVLFSGENSADYKQEGKYSVRYCYNYNGVNQNCGLSATFVIDRTAPIINYNLTNSNKGTITSSTSPTNPLLISTSMVVSDIIDVDPYAYTLISGTKYYLQCNKNINSENCISNIAEYVRKSYTYQKDNPNQVFNIVVYDRAGNSVNSYFKVGTVMPKVSVASGAGNNSFILTIEFFNRNDIDSFTVSYIKSENCAEGACASASNIRDAIMLYINALIYNNYEEIAKTEEMQKEDPTWEPTIVSSVDLTFTLSRVNAGTEGSTIVGGLTIPKITATEVDGKMTYKIEENENLLLPVSKGLYEFTLGDSFYNISKAFGGIGLDKAELNVYVKADEAYVESLDTVTNKVPIPENEVGDGDNTNILKVTTPTTYEFLNYLPEELLNDFDEKMYFTKNFVYVRFKESNFGIVRISKANNLNIVGGYGSSDSSNTNLSCMFTMYGSSVIPKDDNGTPTMTPKEFFGDCNASSEREFILMDDLNNYQDDLRSQGIYIIAKNYLGQGYTYLAFTTEGTYDIWSEIYVAIESGGSTNEWTALPVYYSFTIDRTVPNVGFEVVCSTTDCIGELASFNKSDFVGNSHKVNIGNNNMKLVINLDTLIGGAVNRLLAMSINGTCLGENPSGCYNAYDYAREKSNPVYGNYITFDETGTYEIKFYDAGKNTITYVFIIDKTAPTIDKIEDINGKSFSAYQQYVEVQMVVNEGSFLLNNTGKSMLTFVYEIDGSGEQEISVINNAGLCEISTGLYQDGQCTLNKGLNNEITSISLSFVIAINKDVATRDPNVVYRSLNIRVNDYFGNERSATQTFVFDNLNPYLYFSDEYIPILDFGENVSNEEREKMITIGSDASLGLFNCVSAIKFPVGQNEVEKDVILCGDTPNEEGINNNVIVEAYEAYRVSFNNYKKNADNTYTPMDNGEYLGVNDTVYKKKYYSFASESALNAAISGGVEIYSQGVYTQVGSKDYVDPNIDYYDVNGNKIGNIKDLYVRSDNYYTTCTDATDKVCKLYNMYISKGTFEDDQSYYVYDRNGYSLVSNTSSIVTGDYLSYYYTIETYVEDDGKYLQALTLENTCLKVNGSACTMVSANRIKVKSYDANTFIYYNVIKAQSDESSSSVVRLTMDDSSVVSAVLDNRIWQIAVDGLGEKVKFGFGLASNLGRPIIFVAKDGAGNTSSNYIETVISIRDATAPTVSQVSSVYYEVDNEGSATTLSNYVKKDAYYRLYDIDAVDCDKATGEYYTKNGSDYEKVTDCSTMSKENQYYIKVSNYVPVADGLTKGADTYYKAYKVDLGTNYITSKNLIVKFNEPIYKIECSYYVYDSVTGESVEKDCDLNGAEFDYSEERMIFELIYEPKAGELDYFVNYKLTVYDFSNNVAVVNSLFIDREKPVIKLNSNVDDVDKIETVYVGNDDTTKYNTDYLSTGFMNETTSTDSINNRITNVGATNISNEFTYEVEFYAFNYGLTYKNYVLSGNVGLPVDDGEEKDPNVTYYVKIKKPTNYVLQGNSGVCEIINEEEYCYVQDNYNYYPSLENNNAYWNKLAVGDYIKNSFVGVYKIEYRVIDKSGNVSDTEIKMVYCHDTTLPTISVNGVDTSSKYGYHKEAEIMYKNEREANVYRYKCKDGATNCELPTEIFAPASSNLELEVKAVSSIDHVGLYNSQSIYKVYFHDKGYYISTNISYYDEGLDEDVTIEVMALKYNYIDYTFLIDVTNPELYLNAKIENGAMIYEAQLNVEEYLYCVSGDRNGEDLTFGDQLVQCKNSPTFRGTWKNSDDYVNMANGYEYENGGNLYRLTITNGTYTLYENTKRYDLKYVNNNEYKYSDESNTYIVKIENGSYSLKINDDDYQALNLVHFYKNVDKNIEYKLVVGSGMYLLYVGNDSYNLIENDGVYEYRDSTNYISYSIRYINNKYQIRVMDEKIIKRELYDNNGNVIYTEVYEKLAINAQKYFYNTYYYVEDGNLYQYVLGASYDEDNVYIITSIKLTFRTDGKYLIKAQDKSGNAAGRRTDSNKFDENYSSFIVDNTAPGYNKGNNTPTGANYWYSVPREVITSLNIQNVNNVSKGSLERSHNIVGSGLNSSFFYAFATRNEAVNYLTNIYNAHISSFEDNTCLEGGARGFSYDYYDPASKEIQQGCFVGEDGKSNKIKAQEMMATIISDLVYPTFSGATLFGDNSIAQLACDSTVSNLCINNKDMYKVIYLKVDSSDSNNVKKTVVETCVASATIECIKVNAKIIRNDEEKGNKLNFEIGSENAPDSTKVVIYEHAVGGSTTTSEEYKKEDANIFEITLNNNSYYIFEEFDTTLEHKNFEKGQSAQPPIKHYNVSYYAIYVDKNDYLDIYYNYVDDEYKDGRYDYEAGEFSNTLTNEDVGVKTVKTNSDEYYLIIKNNSDSNFKNRYEIHELIQDGVLLEVYSYLILRIDGVHYNINDYLEKKGNDYYFAIPIGREKVTNVEFEDRAGNVTRIEVSISKVAPTIDVVYNGEGGSQQVTLIVTDSELTKTIITNSAGVTGQIEVYFSPNGSNYSKDRTAKIRASLVCASGDTNPNLIYGCVNTGAVGGINNYRVVISNLESLYGFFRVELKDNHGNTNSLEFIYNPADMSATYSASMRFIDSSMDSSNIRMITNERVQLEFNNEVNYVILYKLVNDSFVEVCNTKNIEEGLCAGENLANKISREVNGEGHYVKSILYYTDEGIYKAKIINRASEVINSVCFVADGDDLVVKEDCKKIKTSTSAVCSWNQNPEYCDDSLEIINVDVSHIYGNVAFNILEVDKTIPQVNAENFVVNLPTGQDVFVNNGVYSNAEITIAWEEDFVQLTYTCQYIDSPETCGGNSTGYSSKTKSYTFAINNTLSTKYEFWFEDYAGNSTFNNKYSFTVEIVLPEIAVYERDENGVIIEQNQVVDGSTINKDVQLLCYVDGANDPKCSTYDVKLERFTGNGYTQVILPDMTKVSEDKGYQTTYRYTISIKNSVTGAVYEYLKTQFLFTIDKQAPTITLDGTYDETWGIYKGEVRVMVSDDGEGTIYHKCVINGIDSEGNNIYVCQEEPLVKFTSNYTLVETGIYKITAIDKVGNITTGREIKYVNIDNEAPTISIKATGQYVDYEISEYGYTNTNVVKIEVSDNNESSYFKYRIKNTMDVYGEWITHVSNSLEITDEGYYEVVPVDAVGNEGDTRHFIIYRQVPKVNLIVGGRPGNLSKNLIEEDFYFYWNETPEYSYMAPIMKVTLNGRAYPNAKFDRNRQLINGDDVILSETGEYMFEFVDLAGNVAIHKMVIDKSDSICLDNVAVTPRAKFYVELEEKTLNIPADEYTFREDDVLIFATMTNYFGGSSACGADLFNYRSTSSISYFVVGDYAKYANANKNLPLTVKDELVSVIDELGGYVYVIVVDIDVARKDLGLPIGENFFTKDPLGWSLIFIGGACVLYVGIRLVFFRKKVRVLK